MDDYGRWAVTRTVEIQADRSDVDTYLFGTNWRGAHLEDPAVESADHAIVGSVPMRADDPQGAHYLYVYLGRALAVGETERIVLREVGRHDRADEFDSVAGNVGSHPLDFSLVVHIDRAVVPVYRRLHQITRSADRHTLAEETVTDQPEGPLTLYAPAADPYTRYAIEWPHPRRD